MNTRENNDILIIKKKKEKTPAIVTIKPIKNIYCIQYSHNEHARKI
jgi:hypothetical protein